MDFYATYRPVAGDLVYIEARAEQVDEVIGIATMCLFNQEGQLMARGIHRKFLPMQGYGGGYGGRAVVKKGPKSKL